MSTPYNEVVKHDKEKSNISCIENLFAKGDHEMSLKKYLLSILTVISIIVIATGCSEKTFATNEINPIEKNKINAVRISRTNLQKEFIEKDLIAKIVDDLNNVTVNKLSSKEDNSVMDNGNVLKKDTTATLELLNVIKGDAISFAFLLSDRELYLCDVKSMQSGKRTVSYLSSNDEKTLKAVKKLYSLLNATADAVNQ